MASISLTKKMTMGRHTAIRGVSRALFSLARSIPMYASCPVLSQVWADSNLELRIIFFNGTGLPPNGKFGIGIYTFGDLTNGCLSIGDHYNPTHKNHGNINQVQSHVGDLGNINGDEKGVAFVNKISRNQFSIHNRNPVAGRAIGICEQQDDLGQGGSVQSLKSGSCLNVQACGIIGLANTGSPHSNSGHH